MSSIHHPSSRRWIGVAKPIRLLSSPSIQLRIARETLTNLDLRRRKGHWRCLDLVQQSFWHGTILALIDHQRATPQPRRTQLRSGGEIITECECYASLDFMFAIAKHSTIIPSAQRDPRHFNLAPIIHPSVALVDEGWSRSAPSPTSLDSVLQSAELSTARRYDAQSPISHLPVLIHTFVSFRLALLSPA